MPVPRTYPSAASKERVKEDARVPRDGCEGRRRAPSGRDFVASRDLNSTVTAAVYDNFCLVNDLNDYNGRQTCDRTHTATI